MGRLLLHETTTGLLEHLTPCFGSKPHDAIENNPNDRGSRVPTYLKTVSFYNRAALIGEFDSSADDAFVNRELDELRELGATIKDIITTTSGGFFKYILTHAIIYDADSAID